MIQIDGSIGGGQVLRTSLSLSAVTGKPFTIENIRKNRSNPGLRPQHIAGVKSCAEICDADISGAKINSRSLKFIPNSLKSKKILPKLSTAGSLGLVLQTLLLPSSQTERGTEINMRGGSTFSKWSPPVLYIREVLLPLLEKRGFKADIEIERDGFYPKGGAIVNAKVQNWKKFQKIDLTDRGELKKIGGFSIASKKLEKSKVAYRQKKEARRIIEDNFPSIEVDIEHEYVDSDCPGSGILLRAEFEDAVIGADSIGEKGKSAERVGKEAANELKSFVKKEKYLDKYAGDQILPFLALGSYKSVLTVSNITEHIETNLEVIEKFVDIKSKINEGKIEIIPQ